MFDKEHLSEEIQKIDDTVTTLQRERQTYSKKRIEFTEKLQRSRDAEATLRAHAIKTREDLEAIKLAIKTKKENATLQISTSTNLAEISRVDSHAKTIFDTIQTLENETRGFNESEFINLKKSIQQKQIQISNIDQQLGVMTQKIDNAKQNISKTTKIISELHLVQKYVKQLDLIQSNIFSRDGTVATSLRSWALDAISTNTSEYLVSLNTKIQRIKLEEKVRDIRIICNSKTEELSIESLSGGEQVSVALALRLGMASLLGASNLNLMILDEPTAHLDAQRKKALVGVLSQLSNTSSSSSNPMQFIISTHDDEIFEDSSVEQIYKFETSENGTIVKAL